MITNQKVQGWLDDIEASRKREKDFRKKGEDILDIYDGEDAVPFNILYSNTETLVPAVYSNTPRPIVKRRFNNKEGDTPLTIAVERACQRMLEYLVDTNVDGYEKFDESMSCAVLDAALPGRGITLIKFDADIGEIQSSELPESEPEELGIETEVENPLEMESEPEETLEWATICTDSVKWNRIYFGYASKWSKVPWMAIEEYLDEEECIEKFGRKKTNKLKFVENEEDDEENDLGEKTGRETTQIYQIWDKNERKVKWISPQYDGFLLEQDDPLGITGFYPIPKPLQFHRKSNSMKVTALYTMYENQAMELNRITKRLNAIIEAIKVRGVYDGNLGDELNALMDEEDNVFLPTDKSAFMGENGGFEKQIWMLPIEKMIVVAQQLFQAREQCKRVIYEITGISDILRGSSAASETLGAQKIKEAWGSMRLKNIQKDVQGYVRDSLRIMLDIAVQNLPIWYWQQVTGLPIPTEEEKQNAIAMIEASKLTDHKPDMDTIANANAATWEEVMEVLQNDYIRSYSIDIETNSTLDVEATEDKKLISEFMNAMAQFMNGTMPMVEKGIFPFEAAKSMFLAISQRFRFGREVEEEIRAMSAPKGNPEIQKAQQKMGEEQKKFEQQKKKATDELNAKLAKLEQDTVILKYERESFAQEKMFEQKLLQMKKEQASTEIEQILKNMFDENQRNLQSNMDKFAARIEKSTKVA